MMMSAGTALALGVIVFTGCRDGETAADADAQAIKRYQSNGQFVIAAQKPDDMSIVDAGNRQVSFRTATGKNGTISFINNGEYYLISIRQALADGLGAWVSGQAMRDVFLIPKVNGRKDPNISAAKAENWKIERIVSDSKSFADIKGIKIYCPTRIEFRKKDGKPHVSEFPARANCADDINADIASVTYK
ncbi:MAG: hypothetical protein RLZZ488_391 [Pseudomonadota bacterium]|jgi:hypothetical protein